MLSDHRQRIKDSHRAGMMAAGLNPDDFPQGDDDMGDIIVTGDIITEVPGPVEPTKPPEPEQPQTPNQEEPPQQPQQPQQNNQTTFQKLLPYLATAAIAGGGTGLLTGGLMALGPQNDTPTVEQETNWQFGEPEDKEP